MNKQKSLKRIIVIAVLIALCFSATFIQIKMPTGDMVHLGNFVMILAALLLGGIEGGLVGSLGMGIYDLIFYFSKPSTILRTFILKFLIGFIVGYLFRLILKKKLKPEKILLAFSIFFLLLFTGSIILFFTADLSTVNFENGLSSTFHNVFGDDESIKISLLIPVFSLLFGIGMIISLILAHTFSYRSKAALFAITIAILVNILGEFVFRWLLEGFFNIYVYSKGTGFSESLITATAKIPGSLITGFISILLTALIYEPVYKGVKTSAEFKDDTINLIDEEKEENKETDEIKTEDVNPKAI